MKGIKAVLIVVLALLVVGGWFSPAIYQKFAGGGVPVEVDGPTTRPEKPY